MKTLNTFLAGLTLIALCAGTCVAQSQSSASQTVTFGVQRASFPSLAANFSPIDSDAESATLDQAPLKLTVGSDVRSEEFFNGTRTTAVKKMRHQKITGSDEFVSASKKQNPFRSVAPKSVITVTE